MDIVQASLRTLRRPATRRGSLGTYLMLPVHGALLWYDVRKRSRHLESAVRADAWYRNHARSISAGASGVDPADMADAGRRSGGGNQAGAELPFAVRADMSISSADPDARAMNSQENAAWAARPRIRHFKSLGVGSFATAARLWRTSRSHAKSASCTSGAS